MTLLAKARANRLIAIETRLDRLTPAAPLFRSGHAGQAANHPGAPGDLSRAA